MMARLLSQGLRPRKHVIKAPEPQQKVTIVKDAEGKIQARGLLPGQTLLQLPTGKLKIISRKHIIVKPGFGVKVLAARK